MDFCRYLSDKSHYMELIRSGERELRRRGFYDPDEVADISAAALERLLDYFQRHPERFISIEKRPESEFSNYLKKALRNHIRNTINQQSRLQKMHNRLVQDPFMLILHDIQPQAIPRENAFGDAVGPDNKDWQGLSWEQIRKEIFYFIEETYGRAKWATKKRAADFFLFRLKNSLTLKEMNNHYPDFNISSLNTEGHRVIRSFRQWVLGHQRSPGSNKRPHDHDHS